MKNGPPGKQAGCVLKAGQTPIGFGINNEYSPSVYRSVQLWTDEAPIFLYRFMEEWPAGTTNLFAALEVLQGRVIGQCFARHRHQEFLKFLRRLDQEFPGPVPLHLVMDNYGTHQHAQGTPG